MKPKDVLDLDVNEVNYLWESISMIEAQDQLKQFEANDFHALSKDDRQSRHRRLFNIAYPNQQKKDSIGLDDLARLFGR